MEVSGRLNPDERSPNIELGMPQSDSELSEEEKNVLPLTGIELQSHSHLGRNVFSIPM
jgi:hypothetical protein